MAAVVGALRVDLGLNSAEFQAGLKKASVGLGNFAKAAGIGLAAVATAAAAAGTALGYAVKGAIDNADKMGELAQSVGVSVEALTSLGYAAQMSGSSTDTLSTALRKLSQNMLTVAQGSTGPVATAFDALGISVQNANGTLLSSDAVLLQVAEKFSQFEDGATKTALAVQLFGRSGAELIPFLNQGAAGIGALTAEADRLGVTISGNTANAAGEFNDTLDRLSATFQGVINKIMQGALPALNNLGNKLADPTFAANAQAIGGAIVQAMAAAVDAINTVVGAFSSLQNAMSWMNNNDMFGNPIDRGGGGKTMLDGFVNKGQALDALRNGGQGFTPSGGAGGLYDGIFPPASGGAQQLIQDVQASEDVLTELSTTLNEVGGGASSAASGTTALSTAMAEGKAVYEATRTPAEAYALEVERLSGLLKQGAIDQETYARAVAKAKDELDKADSSASSLSSTIMNDIGSAIGGLIDGTKSLGSVIGDLASSLANIFLGQGFSGMAGLGGGLGGLGQIFSGLFGFARGGTIFPGGSGGIDSQLVAFRKSPNERVDITKPGQSLSSGGGGAIEVGVSVGVDENGNLMPFVTRVAGQVSGQQIKQNNKQLPGLMRDVNQRYG